MSKAPPVIVRVTPVCNHSHLGDPSFTTSAEAYEGTHLVVNHQGVWVDGEWVIQRDRRMKSNRERGHDWLAEGAPYTGFYVSVETRKEVTP
jgi:hypothetical protein